MNLHLIFVHEISPGTVLIYMAYQMGIHYGESQDISVTDISQSNRREKMLTLANAPRWIPTSGAPTMVFL